MAFSGRGDDNNNDSARFWSYMIATVQTIRAYEDIGNTVLVAFNSLPSPPSKTSLMALINELATSPQKAILELDDYHVISNREIHCGEASKELR